MKQFLYITLLLTALSCSNDEPYFERDYYERISGIKFPETAKPIESIDNEEFVTTTVLQVDSIKLNEFMHDYSFTPVKHPFSLELWGGDYLKKNRPEYSKEKNLYYKTGTSGKNSWLYIIDTDKKLLWAEIQYPDWAGD